MDDRHLPEPPQPLGKAGSRLWNSITSSFEVDDPAGRELLYQAAAASDRLEQLRAAIERQGVTVDGRPNALLKDEASTRGFICRVLQRLGLDAEPLRPAPRRPPGF